MRAAPPTTPPPFVGCQTIHVVWNARQQDHTAVGEAGHVSFGDVDRRALGGVTARLCSRFGSSSVQF
jgi:hypothetical protein